jgi:hypothetical protein
MLEVFHRSCDELGIWKGYWLNRGTIVAFVSTEKRHENLDKMDCILAEIQTEYPVNTTATQANSVSGSLQVVKLRGLSPQANYTDRATAVCRRS